MHPFWFGSTSDRLICAVRAFSMFFFCACEEITTARLARRRYAPANADVAVFGDSSNPCKSRRGLLEKYVEYCDATHGRYGTTKDGYSVPSLRHLMHPLQNLFLGEPNAKRWRREVDEALKRDSRTPGATVGGLLKQTLHVLSDETLDAPPGSGRRRDGSWEGGDSARMAEEAAMPELPQMPAPMSRKAPAAR